MLHKLSEEEATGLLIDVPNWPTQTWWPYLMKMLIDFRLLLPGMDNTLYLPAKPGNPVGTQKQYHTPITRNGEHSAVQGMPVPFQHL